MNDVAQPDARVPSAISHWAPRFVANRVTLTDLEEVTAATPSWNDWCRAWSERAAVHERLGREALDQKRLLTAGEREVTTQQLGELVMRELKKLDKVAYIRFASVYRNFEDVDAFSRAIREVSPVPRKK